MNKELEALKEIYEFVKALGMNWCVGKENNFEIIKSALERKEKLEKVWEIIKKYSISYIACLYNMETYEKYLESFLCSNKVAIITREDYNFVKEMLEEK